MEVIVSLEDRTKSELDEVLSNRIGGRAVSLREGDVNPAAPAYTDSSTLNLASSISTLRTTPNSLTTLTIILPHTLLDRSRL